MTIEENFGKFKATLGNNCFLGKRTREIDLDISWVSCGVYQVQYWRPQGAIDSGVVVAEDWYPANVHISFTPEQFDKAFELFADAPKNERGNCYKPYYEDYYLDNGMFDFTHDELFQAYKDPNPNVDRVSLVNRHFSLGRPTESTSILELSFEDFKRSGASDGATQIVRAYHGSDMDFYSSGAWIDRKSVV